MKIAQNSLLITLILVLCACTIQSTPGEWKSMSGSFDGWRQIGDVNWRIENGEFVSDSGQGHLVTVESYADFQIRMEFWVDEPANSGVFLRASDPDSITDTSSYEANIFDTRPDQTYRTGGVVHYAPPGTVINTGGKWNTYDITVKGDNIVLVLNGITTVDMHDDTYTEGPISLQHYAGIVKFRNVEIRRL